MSAHRDAEEGCESWGRQGWELCKRAVYLNGDPKVAVSQGRQLAEQADVPAALPPRIRMNSLAGDGEDGRNTSPVPQAVDSASFAP